MDDLTLPQVRPVVARDLPGVYCIRNLISGRVYVGSSKKIGARWRAHRRDLQRGSHANIQLQRSWDKHGAGAFVFEILETVENLSDLLGREQFWMDAFSATCPASGFNICKQATSAYHTRELTEDAKARIGAATSLRCRGKPKSPEHAEKLRCHLTTMNKLREGQGKPKAPEHAEKLRQHLTAVNKSEEKKAVIAAHNRSAQMRAVTAARNRTPEMRAVTAARNRQTAATNRRTSGQIGLLPE